MKTTVTVSEGFKELFEAKIIKASEAKNPFVQRVETYDPQKYECYDIFSNKKEKIGEITYRIDEKSYDIELCEVSHRTLVRYILKQLKLFKDVTILMREDWYEDEI